MIKYLFNATRYVIVFFFIIFFSECGSNKGSIELSISEKATLDWMQQTSEIIIPENATCLGYYPYMEYGKIFKFKLDSLNAIRFIQKNRLRQVNSICNRLVLINEIEIYWDDSCTNLINNGDFYFLKKCHSDIVWNLLLEKNTNMVWFEILYPDHGGDIPDCDTTL